MADPYKDTRYENPETDPWLRLAFLGETVQLERALNDDHVSVDYTRPGEYENRDSLMIAAALGRQTKTIEMLKRRDPDPNYKNRRQMTLLHFAAAMGDIPTLGLLSNWKRVDWNVQDDLGWSAYHHAVFADQEGSIILLNSIGKTDMDLKNREYKTATEMAVEMRRSYSMSMRTMGQK